MAKKSSIASAIALRAPLIVLLVVLWVALMGEINPLNILGGLIVAILTTNVFYLPAVLLTDRLNLWRLAVFFGKLFYDIAHASLDVAWLALGPRYKPSNAIVAVRLRTRNDLITTWVGVATSIVPGSIVVDINRVQSILYLHVLDVHSKQEAQDFARSVLATERRVALAIGTREDVARLRDLSERDKGARLAAAEGEARR